MQALESMVHPAAVADTLLRWAGGSGYTGGEAAADPEAVSLLLRAACALWRASPNDSVQARQLEHVRALAALLRSLSNLDKAGTRDHWGPASPAQTPGGGDWSAECTWSDTNKLFATKPKQHGGTAVATAAAGHALLDAHEVLVGEGDLDSSAAVRAAAESAAEWIVEDCGHVRTAAGPVFRWAPGMAHQVYHASAAAAGFLARVALVLSRDAWLKMAVAAVPALPQSKRTGAQQFTLAAEDSTVNATYHAAICESLAVIHRASGSAEAEHLLRRGGAYIRQELFKLQPKSPDTSPPTGVLETLGVRAHAACIAAGMNIFKQIEDADGDQGLAFAKIASTWMTSADSGMRATDDTGVFLSEVGEPMPLAVQAACAYAFALLLEAPEHKRTTVTKSGGGNAGKSGSSLSDLVMSILEPGVSTATHIVMQVSLVIMFVTLGALIVVIGPDSEVRVHLIVMFSLGVGLVLSYMWFMAAMSEMEEEEPVATADQSDEKNGSDTQTDVRVEGTKKSKSAKKPQRSKKAD
eukprot:COSAG02_NODE_87_length_38906_cov_69.688697_16_plen_524_part_00